MAMESALVLIKPDGLKKSLTENILTWQNWLLLAQSWLTTFKEEIWA
ncbi:MAG TPA: hypothetical protein VLM75_15350 [Spirochaetota bacterium]|nr:hypothetical protein [Spirochaetota bacterium]